MQRVFNELPQISVAGEDLGAPRSVNRPRADDVFCLEVGMAPDGDAAALQELVDDRYLMGEQLLGLLLLTAGLRSLRLVIRHQVDSPLRSPVAVLRTR